MVHLPSLLALGVLLSGCASRWEMQVEPGAGAEAPGDLATIPVDVSVQTPRAPGSDRMSPSVVLSGDLILDFAQSLVKHRVFDSVRLPDASDPETGTMLRVDQHVEWDGIGGRAVFDFLTLGITHCLFETGDAVVARGEVTLRRAGQDVRAWKARSVVGVTYKSGGRTKEREAEACWAAIEALHLDLIGQVRRDRALFTEEADRQAMSAGARPRPVLPP